MSCFSPQLKRLILAASALLLSNGVIASGFQLWEEGSAGVGNYHAGGAAEADDASTEYYNPAGMVRIPRKQISVGGVFVPAQTTFNGTIIGPPPLSITSNTPPGGVSGDTTNIIPNMHLVIPLENRFFFGFGVTSPFGLATNYPSNLPAGVSQEATETKIITLNINPSIAYAFNDFLSIGAGFDAIYAASGRYNALVNLGPKGIYNFSNSLTGMGIGYNGGVLLQFTPMTRLGVSYRSSMRISSSGSSRITNVIPSFIPPLTLPPIFNDISSVIPLPATTTISLYHDLTARLAVMGSAFYTQWSDFSKLIFNNSAIPPALGGPNLTILQNYRNTWNYAVGANYKISPNWTVKIGGGLDETPTVRGNRDIRLPDTVRYAVAAGVEDQVTCNTTLDLGVTQFFMPHANVDNVNVGTPLVPIDLGISNTHVTVFGAQLTVSFGV